MRYNVFSILIYSNCFYHPPWLPVLQGYNVIFVAIQESQEKFSCGGWYAEPLPLPAAPFGSEVSICIGNFQLI